MNLPAQTALPQDWIIQIYDACAELEKWMIQPTVLAVPWSWQYLLTEECLSTLPRYIHIVFGLVDKPIALTNNITYHQNSFARTDKL